MINYVSRHTFLKRGILIVIVAVVALTVGYTGFGALKHPSSSVARDPLFPSDYRVTTLSSDKQVAIARGHHLTVVMLMASWCLYCAYEDKYVWPQVIRTDPGMTINIVDVSQYGGIGAPGPQSPPFTGHDNVGPAITVLGMRRTMQQYQARYGLHEPQIHVFIDPTGLTYWNATTFPTLLFINSSGHLVERINGALPPQRMLQVIYQLGHDS